MPEEKKSNRKNEPKEQRRSRRRNDQQVVKREENQQTSKQPEINPKITAPEKPAYEPPGPEFYKSLKRETDEILKITEEANLKYKKKEIQSNWAKYEMPIESYNEIEEQENMGADFETLIQAPLSIGGHFQFKHEKSWDISSGPSLYDKYFEIDMDKLAIALSTIPFYERNSLDKSIFNETDILNMNNRVTKFKQKYYNDKSYTTPELDVQEKILNSLTKSDENDKSDKNITYEDKEDITQIKTNLSDFTKSLDISNELMSENVIKISEKSLATKDKETLMTTNEPKLDKIETEEIKPSEPDNLEENKEDIKILTNTKTIQVDKKFVDDIEDIIDIVKNNADDMKKENTEKSADIEQKTEKLYEGADDSVKETKLSKNPIIESPEDLEKWLDDFLDG
ncbi:unnamed protein product [Parnassius apollo]|uniref:(apollo) hypothetical protein n=1 Tax=Parnassius apollo TaxID=110799 RepID=A0A8S3XW95_PARAO|nr:unnamed protein product [Parnassius apollo]